MREADARSVLANVVANQIGGSLALDFCNTAGEHLAAQPDEMLADWETFARWAVQAGLIGTESYAELLRAPAPVAKVIRLRESIYRVGLAIARGGKLPEADLLAIREQAGAGKPEIVSGRDGLRWRPDPARASAQLRAQIASEALALFCSPRAARIGVCDGGLCGWLFLDDSRGKRRRWCDMKDCGNRAKARRYYEQQKAK